MQLSDREIRVLGALMEKEITTPEYYPLSLNALQAACNQRSSRHPVYTLSEEEVRQALHTLQDQLLVTSVSDSRVPKYEHRARTVLNLRRDETALLCLLLLRGAQTPGELRSRADRLFTFDDLEAVETSLDRLAKRPAASEGEVPATPPPTGPLVKLLPRAPGSREARYIHLLGGSPGDLPSQELERPPTINLGLEAEVAALRSSVASLEQRINELEAKIALSESVE